MITFIHTSDSHIGHRHLSEDFREIDMGFGLAQVISYAINHKVDFIVHSGDLMNKRTTTPEAFNQLYDLLFKLKEANIPIYLIEGNHDNLSIRVETWLDIYNNLGVIHLLRTETNTRFGNSGKKTFIQESTGEKVNIYGIGYQSNNLNSNIKKLSKELNATESNIILLHTTVDDYGENDTDETQISLVDLKNALWKKSVYVALGHHHSYRVVGRKFAYYSGASEPTKYTLSGDEQGGFIYIELDAVLGSHHTEYVKTKNRQVEKHTIIAKNNWEDIRDQAIEIFNSVQYNQKIDYPFRSLNSEFAGVVLLIQVTGEYSGLQSIKLIENELRMMAESNQNVIYVRIIASVAKKAKMIGDENLSVTIAQLEKQLIDDAVADDDLICNVDQISEWIHNFFDEIDDSEILTKTKASYKTFIKQKNVLPIMEENINRINELKFLNVVYDDSIISDIMESADI